MIKPWVSFLKNYVAAKPCVILRFGRDELEQLRASRLGVNEFTFARPHALFSRIRVPTVCFIFCSHLPIRVSADESGKHSIYMGIISSRSPITTLETRIKIKRAVRISPDTENRLISLLSGRYAASLKRKLSSKNQVLLLSSKLSEVLIAALFDIRSNHGAMRTIAESLSSRSRYCGFSELQKDAIQTALKAFGLGSNDRACKLELAEGKETALVHIPIMEDSVIEHDARSVPQYAFAGSDITGRAIFRKDNEELEIFTANRNVLEKVFGVDLIYLNLTKRNIVMVQYKMLEPEGGIGAVADWIYRPDKNMASEISRMKKFSKTTTPGPLEYRLNSEMFYFKFIKRDSSISSGNIITPLSHYECLTKDPKCKGPRGAFRVSYDSLAGRYLRQAAFINLIHSGYIGSYADTTDSLMVLIESVLCGNRAVVAAIERHV